MKVRFETNAQIALLATLAAYFLIWPLWRLQFPMEIAGNEGWNAYHADAAVGAAPLYPSQAPLAVNNYPPLSAYLHGYLGLMFGDPLYVGRVLSIVAVLGIGGMIARIAGQFGASRAAAAIGGIWFVALMTRSFNRFVGMNDPQLFAQLIMVIALSWFLARDRAGRSAEPPILLMVLAGFFKHNIIVIPAAVMLWIVIRDGRRSIRPVAVGIAAAAFGLAACVAFYGEPFIANMLTERPTSLGRALRGLGRLQWILPALVIWAIWAVSERKSHAARFTALLVGLGLASHFAQWTGEGTLDNTQFDLAIATAIGVALAYDRIAQVAFVGEQGAVAARALIVAILVVRLLATLRIEPFLILTDSSYRAQFYENAAATRADAARVAAIPGPVACYLTIICRAAGKPLVFDDFKAEMMMMRPEMKGVTMAELARRHGLPFYPCDPRSNIEVLHRSLFGAR